NNIEYGIRVYNLFPKLLGSIDNWYPHLDRIKDMNFDWVYLNPLNYPGFSGSLYAIKDFYKFNPTFAPKDEKDPYSWNGFRKFVKKCHEMGLKVMYDLIINHTSIDSPLIEEHPEWFIEKWAIIHKLSQSPVKFFESEEKPQYSYEEYPPDKFILEKRILSPYAIDPADARRITIWGDLAVVNNKNSSDLNNLTKYWLDLIEFYLDIGIDGFRCDAAYQVPQDMWKTIIDYAKDIRPDVFFLAETLGCTIEEMEKTVQSGFDYICNSSKWWDYTQFWLIEQYEKFRKFTKSLSFPESHDTERVASMSNGRIDVQEFKYFFAAFFSSGVMMPFGYEYGFKKKMDVIDMTPDDMETPIFDISEFIRRVNKFKISLKTLNYEGPIKLYNYPDSNILIMKKTSPDEEQCILLIYNKDWNNEHMVNIINLRNFLTLDKNIFTINLDREMRVYPDISYSKNLKPNEYVLFIQE
ncbi:MAG: alpha-amylase family glycosyl hydrolase, partial [Promethearchaeota archaeon]